MNSSLGVLELSIMGLAVRNQMRLIGQHYDRWRAYIEGGGVGGRGGLDCALLPADCGSSKSCVCASAFDHQENPLVSNFLRLPASKNTPNQRASRSKKKTHPHHPQNSIKRNMYQNIIRHLFSPRNKSKRTRGEGGGGGQGEGADKITSTVCVLQVGDKLTAACEFSVLNVAAN